MSVRELQKDDFYKGYMDILIPFVGNNGTKFTNYKEFCDCFDQVMHQDCKIFVIEHMGCVIGTATAIIEHKFHHPCMGHIEDVAILSDYQNKGYGKKLVEYAKHYCIERNCYKIVLSCREELEPFYKINGFNHNGNCMVFYNNDAFPLLFCKKTII